MPLWVPLALPWVLATVLAFLDGRHARVAWLGVVGLAATVACVVGLLPSALSSSPQELVTGGWPEGIGIRLRGDALSVVFALVSTAMLCVVLTYEHLTGGIRSRSFPSLVLFLSGGLNGVFLTGDAFNFYVFFELAMTSAFALAAYGDERPHLRAAFTFVVVNLMGSMLFLSAVVMLYQMAGTLDLRLLAQGQSHPDAHALDVPGALLLAAMGVKLGFFPFHFWAPAVYRDAGPTVAALLGGALANIGGYGLVRFGGDVLPRVLEHGEQVVGWLGAVSIVYGSLLAVSRRDAREVLAYASISQAGLILVALGLRRPEALAAAVALSVAGSADKTALFLAQGLGGTRARGAFAVAAFSTAGVPVTLGFWAKAALLRAALSLGRPELAALVVLSSALSLVALFRVWQRQHWEEGPVEDGHRGAAGAVVWALAAALIVVGVWPEPLLHAGWLAARGLSGGAP